MIKKIGFLSVIIVALLCLNCTDNAEKTSTDIAKVTPKVFLASVTKVADGDTLWVISHAGKKDKIKIRMLHIDTPETKQQDGDLAKAALKNMAPIGATVKVQQFGYDQYGRMLGVLYPYEKHKKEIESSINYRMVQEGFAWADRHYSPIKSFIDSESAARREQIGIWAYKKNGRVIPPWFFRRGITEVALKSIFKVTIDCQYQIEPNISLKSVKNWLYILVRGEVELKIYFAPFRENIPGSVNNGAELAEKLNLQPWMLLGEGLYKPAIGKLTLYQDWFSPYSEGDMILTSIVMQRWINTSEKRLEKKVEMDLSKTEWPISYAVPFFQMLD